MADTKIKWNGRDVKRQADTALKTIGAKIAFDAEAETKSTITAKGLVDVGFMRNSTYANTHEGKRGGAASGRFVTGKTGRSVKRASARMASIGDSLAVVGVGALYAIFVERKWPFFRPSVERVSAAVGGIARIIWRQKVRG